MGESSAKSIGFQKMVLSFLLMLLFMSLVAEIKGGSSQDEKCMPSLCSLEGPVIRFPFRLKHQPEHCGYPGFELSCSDDNRTVLEVPHQGPLLVRHIDYMYQSIDLLNMDPCLRRQNINHNISASPLIRYTNISFFSCSENKQESYSLLTSIPCNFLSTNTVYAVDSTSPFRFYSKYLSSCRKVFSATLPEHILERSYVGENYSYIHWSIPDCGDCEVKGRKCQRKKSDSSQPEIECIGEDPPIDKVVLTEVILGCLHFTLGIFIIFVVYRSNKLKREHRISIQKFLEDYRALKPSRYSYANIKKITSNFKHKLGQGGYGTVYKGKLSNEVFVAVKVLDDFKGNGDEFINEVGTMSTIHHVNIVRLLGYCADRYKRALIYEFLPNESLDKFIFSRHGDNHSLSWPKLQDIATGIAKGIEYLHQGCNQRILHLDIKPHNILLDHNLNPKISDFGLAKLCSREQSTISMTVARGTMGYIAPEMLSRNFGSVSYKSDVFSFGMLLIEMVGGRKNVNISLEHDDETYFPEWLYNHLGQEQEVHIRIEEEGDVKIATKLSIIGLWCIQWYPIDRPSMKIVVEMLEGEGENLVMPQNPFASIRQTHKTDKRHKAHVQPNLTAISEIEENVVDL